MPRTGEKPPSQGVVGGVSEDVNKMILGFFSWLGGMLGPSPTFEHVTQPWQETAGRIAQVGGQQALTGFVMSKFVLAQDEAFGVLGVMEDLGLQKEIQRSKGRIMERIAALDFKTFRRTWASARQLIGLQGRLYMEQCFWELGEPWRLLVTGFDPVDTEASSASASVGAASVREPPPTNANVVGGSAVTSSGGPRRWTRVRRV